MLYAAVVVCLCSTFTCIGAYYDSTGKELITHPCSTSYSLFCFYALIKVVLMMLI